VFDDWIAVKQLLNLLDQEMHRQGMSARVVLVDDGSWLPIPPDFTPASAHAFTEINVLALRRNLGHQRAIAVGLSYIEAHLPCRAVVVMDGDGEDAPGDVPTLLRRFEELSATKVIFAERARRTERFSFRVYYQLYKAFHLVLTGERVRVGNFSVIPFDLLTRLVAVSDLWNHYAAAVFKSCLPYSTIPLSRGKRLAGESRMNFVSLVIHGLSAMSVYGDRIGVRLLTATVAAILFTLTALLTLVGIRLGTGLSIPVWATYATGFLLVALLQIVCIAIVFIFIVLAGRDSSSFLPIRDYSYFVQDFRDIEHTPKHEEVRDKGRAGSL
jgi:hypothetical protein